MTGECCENVADIRSATDKQIAVRIMLYDEESALGSAPQNEDDSACNGLPAVVGGVFVPRNSLLPEFTLFCEPTMAAEFRAFCRSYFDFYTLIAIYSVGFSFIGSRFSLDVAYESNVYFKIGFAFLMLAWPAATTFLVARALKLADGRVCGWTFPTNILERAFWGHLEDFVAILITITNGFYLYARVERGACTAHERSSLWLSQRCNPSAESGSLPMDEVILVFLIPVILQISLRGVTLLGAITCWLTSIAFVLASLIRVQSWLDFWILVEAVWFLAVLLEYERFMRVSFRQRKELIASIRRERNMERQKAKAQVNLLQERHQSNLLEVRLTAEKEHMEQESVQLRSLIGNVAHDLKTPLQSIAMDMEWLRDACTQMHRQLQQQQHLLLVLSQSHQCLQQSQRSSRGRTNSATLLLQQQQQGCNKNKNRLSIANSDPESIPSTITLDDIPPRCVSTEDGFYTRGEGVGEISNSVSMKSLLVGSSFSCFDNEDSVIRGDLVYVDHDTVAAAAAPPLDGGGGGGLGSGLLGGGGSFSAVTVGTAKGKEEEDSGEGEKSEIDKVLDSLDSTVSFMAMAINRSIDFAKASSGIALKPMNETLDFSQTLRMPLSLISTLQSTAADITIAPPPEGMCRFIVSDKQWLCENVLCLLSNAVKFSEGRHVDIITELIGNRPVSNPKKPIDIAAAGGGGGSNDSEFLKGTVAGQQSSQPQSQSRDERVHLTDCLISNNNNGDNSNSGTRLGGGGGGVDTSVISHVKITVVDAGVGLSEEVRKELFKPFKQAQRMTGGTGLGLYSLSKRIDALGGQYGVDARADGCPGCSFWFTFPYRPDESYTSLQQTASDSCQDNINGSKARMAAPGTGAGETTEAVVGVVGGMGNIYNNNNYDNSSKNTGDAWVKSRQSSVAGAAMLLSRRNSGVGLASLEQLRGSRSGYNTGTATPNENFMSPAVSSMHLAAALAAQFPQQSGRGNGVTPPHIPTPIPPPPPSVPFPPDVAVNDSPLLASKLSRLAAPPLPPGIATQTSSSFPWTPPREAICTTNRHSPAASSHSGTPHNELTSAAIIPLSLSPSSVSSASLASSISVPIAAAPAPLTVLATATSLPSLRALLVDDSMAILKVTGRALQQAGHTVETALNGSRALDRLMTSLSADGTPFVDDFDFVLMDLQMPVMDGFECVRRFRAAEVEAQETYYQRAEQQQQQQQREIVGTVVTTDTAADAVAVAVAVTAGGNEVAAAALHSNYELSSSLDPNHVSTYANIGVPTTTAIPSAPGGGKKSEKNNTPTTATSTTSSSSRLLELSDVISTTGSSSSSGTMKIDETTTVITAANSAIAKQEEAEKPAEQMTTTGESSGFGFGAAVQNRRRRLPIIGMSANSDDVSKELALSVGMDVFIAKPFALKNLQPLLLRFVVMTAPPTSSPAYASSTTHKE